MKDRKRNIKKNNITGLILGLAVIILVNVIASFVFTRFDLTAERRYSISPATKKLLKRLDDVVLFHPGGSQTVELAVSPDPIGFGALTPAADGQVYRLDSLGDTSTYTDYSNEWNLQDDDADAATLPEMVFAAASDPAQTIAFTGADAAGKSVKYSSEDESIATVDQNGVVTPTAGACARSTSWS